MRARLVHPSGDLRRQLAEKSAVKVNVRALAVDAELCAVLAVHLRDCPQSRRVQHLGNLLFVQPDALFSNVPDHRGDLVHLALCLIPLGLPLVFFLCLLLPRGVFRFRLSARLVGLRVLQRFPAVVKRNQPLADLGHPRVELAKRFRVHPHGFRFRIALRRRVEFFLRRLFLRVELRNLVINGLRPRFPVVKHGFPRRRVLRDDGLSARLSRLCQPLCRRLLHFVRSARGDRALLVRGFLVFAHAHARFGHFLLPRQVAAHHRVARFRELRPAVVRRRLCRFRLCARLVGLLLGLCRVCRAAALVLPADDFLGNGLAFLLLPRVVVEQRAGLLVAQRLCHVQDDVLHVRPLAVHQVLRRLHAAQRAHAASHRAGQGEQHRADGVLHRAADNALRRAHHIKIFGIQQVQRHIQAVRERDVLASVHLAEDFAQRVVRPVCRQSFKEFVVNHFVKFVFGKRLAKRPNRRQSSACARRVADDPASRGFRQRAHARHPAQYALERADVRRAVKPRVHRAQISSVINAVPLLQILVKVVLEPDDAVPRVKADQAVARRQRRSRRHAGRNRVVGHALHAPEPLEFILRRVRAHEPFHRRDVPAHFRAVLEEIPVKIHRVNAELVHVRRTGQRLSQRIGVVLVERPAGQRAFNVLAVLRPAVSAVFVLVSVLDARRVDEHHALRIARVQAVLEIQIPLFNACVNARADHVARAHALTEGNVQRRHFLVGDRRALLTDAAGRALAKRVHVHAARLGVVFVQRQPQRKRRLRVFFEQRVHLLPELCLIVARVDYALRVEVQLHAA